MFPEKSKPRGKTRGFDDFGSKEALRLVDFLAVHDGGSEITGSVFPVFQTTLPGPPAY
ncbi:MAG: hypothetical protein ABS900_12415 [Candidatus Limivicinus sp.]